MDGMNQEQEIQQEPQVNPVQGGPQAKPPAPARKKSKIPGVILLVIGVVLVIAGLSVAFLGGKQSSFEKEDPVDIYLADKTDQYVYTPVKYMTESVAYYEAMENMQFYIALDSEWNMVAVCLHTNELKQYQPYINWLYSDSDDNEPEETRIIGYSQVIDRELKELLIDGVADVFGEGHVDDTNFEDYFGQYYIQVGEKNAAYNISNVGIYILLAAVILIVIGGVMVYEKPVQANAEYMGNAVIAETHTGLGILGALLGALLGGLLWTIINVLGYVSGWIGILIVFFAYTGYKILAHKEGGLGIAVSLIFAVLVVIPATYLGWGWSYYQEMNESMAGYTTLGRALMEMPAYLSGNDLWQNFIAEVAMGYGFMLIAGIYALVSVFAGKNKKK